MTSAINGIELRRIEEAGLNALQTQRQLFYDGWLLRLSAGKAKRARSVNAHFGSTLPLDAKIAHCEKVYAQHGLPPLFRLTPFDAPADLDRALAARGYQAFDETAVQVRAMVRPPELAPEVDGVVIEAPDVDAFAATVGAMRGSTARQIDAHRERLDNSPLGKRFAIVRAAGRVVCAAQVALEGELCGIFDVVTADDARRQGHASRACASLMSWAWQHGAKVAYLQVTADNAPAVAVYRKFGFATAYTYHYRGPPGQCE